MSIHLSLHMTHVAVFSILGSAEAIFFLSFWWLFIRTYILLYLIYSELVKGTQ